MKAIFLDRDGVICENRDDYVKSWSEFQFIPGAKRSMAALSKLGLPIVIVTNQAGVGRGVVSAEMVESVHSKMVTEIMASGGRIDRILYCPHRPDEYCDCRKPEPGMLLQAAREMNIDLSQSYMVGDAATDLAVGHAVGCESLLVLTGRGIRQFLPSLHMVGDDFTVCRNLMQATSHILRKEVGAKKAAAIWRIPMSVVPARTQVVLPTAHG